MLPTGLELTDFEHTKEKLRVFGLHPKPQEINSDLFSVSQNGQVLDL
jgi:hypothetical protein